MLLLLLVLGALSGRARAVAVATFAELQASVGDVTVAEIELAADIVVTNVLVVDRALRLKGFGFTLDGGGATALFKVSVSAALTLEQNISVLPTQMRSKKSFLSRFCDLSFPLRVRGCQRTHSHALRHTLCRTLCSGLCDRQCACDRLRVTKYTRSQAQSHTVTHCHTTVTTMTCLRLFRHCVHSITAALPRCTHSQSHTI